MFYVSCFKKKGIAALITTITLGGLIMTIVFGMAIISFWANQNAKSIKDANKAFYAAYSGIQDAQIKLERNKDYNSSFNLSINGINDVSVNLSNINGVAIATSTSSLGLTYKKIQAVFLIDNITGIIIPTSTIELAL